MAYYAGWAWRGFHYKGQISSFFRWVNPHGGMPGNLHRPRRKGRGHRYARLNKRRRR